MESLLRDLYILFLILSKSSQSKVGKNGNGRTKAGPDAE